MSHNNLKFVPVFNQGCFSWQPHGEYYYNTSLGYKIRYNTYFDVSDDDVFGRFSYRLFDKYYSFRFQLGRLSEKSCQEVSELVVNEIMIKYGNYVNRSLGWWP